MISCALKGFDNFDVRAATERGVKLTFVPDLLTIPTAELAVGLAINLLRNVPAGDAVIRATGEAGFHGWRPILYGKGLGDCKLGLLGLGAVGQAVHKMFVGFDESATVAGGSSALYYDPGVSREDAPVRLLPNYPKDLPGPTAVASVEALFGACDLVFVCTPLSPDTRHIVGAEELALLADGAFLVNISRGSCVDEAAVAQALESGKLAGYAADVFECEDWHLPDRPRAIDERLLSDTARTLFSPHIGSATLAARQQIELAAANALLTYMRGESLPDTICRN
jgi:phosphonate dehydrogenase